MAVRYVHVCHATKRISLWLAGLNVYTCANSNTYVKMPMRRSIKFNVSCSELHNLIDVLNGYTPGVHGFQDPLLRRSVCYMRLVLCDKSVITFNIYQCMHMVLCFTEVWLWYVRLTFDIEGGQSVVDSTDKLTIRMWKALADQFYLLEEGVGLRRETYKTNSTLLVSHSARSGLFSHILSHIINTS